MWPTGKFWPGSADTLVPQLRVDGDDGLRLGARPGDDVPVAGDLEQVQVARPARLGGAEHIALAAQGQVRLGQGEAVADPGEGPQPVVGREG